MIAPSPPLPSLPSKLSIGSEIIHDLSPLLHSLFFETEINFGGEGGVYAELLPNRDLETLGRGRVAGVEDGTTWPQPYLGSDHAEEPFSTQELGQHRSATLDPHEPAPMITDYRPWSALFGARLWVDNATAPFPANPHSLRVAGGPGVGVANPGYWGIAVQPGSAFNLSLYARTGAAGVAVRLRAVLRSVSGGTVLAEAEVRPALSDPSSLAARPGWARSGIGGARASGARGGGASANARFELLIDAASFWLDAVSLIPADAVGGLFRRAAPLSTRDAFERLQATRPGFVRAPGGNYLEGIADRNRAAATLGPPAARAGHYNSAYWVTDGLGLFELLTLCELLHSTCQMSIYTGYSMGRRYVPVAQSETFAQDAVDMLDFANAAPASSPWAAVRERMGHAAPFGLSRVEVGNEERDMSGEGYPAHYELITRRLWAAYPSLHIVASGRWGPPIEGSPCLTGQRCDLWDDHYYRPPDVMAAMGGEYDRYNRSLPKVYVGEFAANGATGASSLGPAAIFMIGFERNADVVVASSFAPLCNNSRLSRVTVQPLVWIGTQWAYNLVNLNSSRLFVLPSYHVQTLFSSALGAHTLPATLTPPYAQGVKAFSRRRGLSSSKPPQPRLTTAPPASRWIATASMDARARLVNLKLVNYAPNARPVDVAWSGERAFARVLNATVLTAASADAQNNLSMPDAVAPAALDPPPALGPTGLSIAMPPWSLVVVTVALDDQ
ncbi:hypothetical protein EMIHUDRAFT_203580 [Emiliania huxleyi CCMP1516]|uniref:non-reducing end alpha-L-arabinofuranosidase n=2 Tax=Emiliania huxleyi TaxID=2903 RepID=A0A0D3K2X3_EMIH1|nr:hypothetical protein EMIHUDRAFT_203580 [Emiliania huxleyi CCMP1516]EOD30108.1 hypothetical protein EMIHUDRAFT_203580 [Emiliania huxleyi CCMP1516]|eukprot:XP_005782537.1 hypothetical protein EMIHUDRAFT_203580 [Emiliania huxleyi CCMP1516]